MATIEKLNNDGDLLARIHPGPKVAILVQGMFRTGALCWPRIAIGFAPYRLDVYVLSHEPEQEAEIRRVINPTTLFMLPDLPQEEREYASHMGPGQNSLQVQLRQLSDLRKLSELVRETGIKYDWLVRTRTDLDMITLPEPLETRDPTAIYFPTHDNWFGLNDRFFLGCPELVHRAMERYYRLPEFWQEQKIFHMETFLGWVMRDVAVRRTRTTFGSWRMNGDRLPPYRNAAWGDVPALDFCNKGA